MPFWGKNRTNKSYKNVQLQRFLTLRYLVHELDSKTDASRLHSGNKKHNMDSYYPQDLCFLEKYDRGSDSVAFVQNSGILKTRMDKMGDHMKINFDYIQIKR